MKLLLLCLYSFYVATVAVRAFDPFGWVKDTVDQMDPLFLMNQVSRALPGIDVGEIEQTFIHVGQEAIRIEKEIKKALTGTNVTPENFVKQFSREFERQRESLQREFNAVTTLTEKDMQDSAGLGRAVDQTLLAVEGVFVDVCVQLQIKKADAHKIFRPFKKVAKSAILISAKAVHRHPCLFEVILLFAAGRLPLSWVVQPILSVMGFGPKGPIKGGFAAAFQRSVFKGEIPKGGFFSEFQKTAMKPSMFEGKVLGSLDAFWVIASLVLRGCIKVF